MKSKLIRKNIYLKKSTVHGYGVFANEDIHAQEIIEECVIIKRDHSDGNLYKNYYFADTTIELSMLALGYGSIYNHSDLPNATYEFDVLNSLLTFRAESFIKKGEEIFIFYSPNWFTGRGIKKIERFRYKSKLLKPLFFLFLRFAVVVSVFLNVVLILRNVTLPRF